MFHYCTITLFLSAAVCTISLNPGVESTRSNLVSIYVLKGQLKACLETKPIKKKKMGDMHKCEGENMTELLDHELSGRC